MMKKRFSEVKIAFALRQAEAGVPVKEVIRKMGITEQTFYCWKKVYAGMDVAEVSRLKQLENENRCLLQLYRDLINPMIDQDVMKYKMAKKGNFDTDSNKTDTELSVQIIDITEFGI